MSGKLASGPSEPSDTMPIEPSRFELQNIRYDAEKGQSKHVKEEAGDRALFNAGVAHGARKERAARDHVAERLLFAIRIYRGYDIKSRGPYGCILDAIEMVRPDMAKAMRECADWPEIDTVYDRFFPDEEAEASEETPPLEVPVVYRIIDDTPSDRDCMCAAKKHCDAAPHKTCGKKPARWFALEGWIDSLALCDECSADLRRKCEPPPPEVCEECELVGDHKPQCSQRPDGGQARHYATLTPKREGK